MRGEGYRREVIAHDLWVGRSRIKKTQKEVAEIIGVSKPTISAYETGRTLPSEENLKKLYELYGLDLEKTEDFILRTLNR